MHTAVLGGGALGGAHLRTWEGSWVITIPSDQANSENEANL